MDNSRAQYSSIFSKTNVALFLIAAMLVGFLCARAVGSVAIFLFAVNALRDISPRTWCSKKWWLFGLVWVGMYALSGFWTETQGPWNDAVQTKLPFLLLPLAFSFLPRWDARTIRIYTVILLVIIGGGILYSMSFLADGFAELVHSYKRSKTLRTPVYDDHISFSVSVAMSIGWALYSLRFWKSRFAKVVLVALACFFAVYLHILAAKTGLISFYLLIIALIFYFGYKNWKLGILAAIGLVGAVYLAFKFVPTFHERVIYTYYNYELLTRNQLYGNYSDVGRIISYDVAQKIIRQHPVIGVGAGDMMYEMSKGYDKWYPYVTQEQRLIPHNQFMIVALAAGIPALIAFIIWIIAPFRFAKRNRNGFFFGAFWFMFLVPLFTDTALEVQFGVFVYLFFFLVQRHMLMRPAPENEE